MAPRALGLNSSFLEQLSDSYSQTEAPSKGQKVIHSQGCIFSLIFPKVSLEYAVNQPKSSPEGLVKIVILIKQPDFFQLLGKYYNEIGDGLLNSLKQKRKPLIYLSK